MKKIILTSYGFQKNNKLSKQILELISGPIAERRAVIITTASVDWKERNKHAILTKQALESMGFKEVVFLDIEFENPDKLRKFDLIYINGGNPFYLLFYLKNSGADNIIIELANKGVVIVGASAGGVVLGPNIEIVNYFDNKVNAIKIKDFSGLSLTNNVIYPHYTEDIENKIKEFEAKFKVIVDRLSDQQSIVIKN